jgi:hypothetical protein
MGIQINKKLLILAAVFVAAAAAINSAVMPFFSSRSALSRQIESTKKLLRTYQELAGEKGSLTAEYEAYARYLTHETRPEDATPLFLKDVESIAKRSSLTIVRLAPDPLKKHRAYWECSVAIEAESSMQQLITFFYNLHSAKKLFRVSKFRINPKEGQPDVIKSYVTVTKAFLAAQ